MVRPGTSDVRAARRQVPPAAADGAGRAGRDLRGAARGDRPSRGGEDDPPGVLRGPGGLDPLPPGGAGGRRGRPSGLREDLRLRRLGRRRVKLLDFGIARLTFDVRPADARLTRPGATMGTPFYMAPEQARGALDADRRIDLYAVGVLLFEMTTGRVPFDGPNSSAILVQVLTAPFPSLRTLEPSLPEDFEALVRRA
ncbi:MAG: protein kinase, partial [Deltaproteobacteria bacterium]|nr:protein kinase [Deltaproteobacteria bacterium]